MGVTIKKSMALVESCEVHSVHVIISDVPDIIKKVFENISDTSWIENLENVAAKKSFAIAAKRTISRLALKVFNGDDDALTEHTGEYVVSVTALNALRQEYNHKTLPLSELWKEQVAGNPSFDFHSVCPKSMLLFGESKYSGKRNPHGVALTQIKEFIEQEKDITDLVGIERFVGVHPIKRFEDGFKMYAAAFSVNAKNASQIMKNAAKSEKAKPLFCHNGLFLIGIELKK